LADFRARHLIALEQNEARHMMMLGVLNAPDIELAKVRCWTLGDGAQCALLRSNGLLILGDLDAEQCRAFSSEVAHIDYEGVIGADDSAAHFVEQARRLGIDFLDPMLQRIHRLAEPPCYPDAPGSARLATVDDARLLTEWMEAFVREATPNDTPPTIKSVEKGVLEGRYFVWVVDDRPVSTAAIVRRTRHTGGIAAVFTPQNLRGKGYAGSVTAAVVDALFREGKAEACINTDLSNPISNRCYAKIGFRPVCDTAFFPRRSKA
jgi:RimJ/RimL family protein N-acetyltransferase